MKYKASNTSFSPTILHTLIIGCIVGLTSINYKIITQNGNSNVGQIDSVFRYHFTLLDSSMKVINNLQKELIIQDKVIDTSRQSIIPDYYSSVDFLERITDIPANTNMTYTPTKVLDYELTRRWKSWYRNNYHLLIWEDDKKRINRKDKDIYTGKLNSK